MDRWEVRFSGRVQGVGFRATVCDIAREHRVSGWVRNELDGSVLLVAEGETPVLEAFLSDIRGRMRLFIRSDTIQRLPARSDCAGFSIRRS